MPLAVYGTCPVIDNDLKRFLQLNRAFSDRVATLLRRKLEEEEKALHLLCEQSLLDASLRDSATMQLGKVELLRKTLFSFRSILGEQIDG